MKLKVNGKPIEGESSERHYEKQIALERLGWSTSAEHEAGLDKKDTKHVEPTNTPQPVTITKAFDRSSTNLCTYVAERTRFDEAVITMVKGAAWDKDGAIPRRLIEVTLTDGLVESVSMNATESGTAVGVSETVTLSYRNLKILYYPDRPERARGELPPTEFSISLPKDG